jgi:hypothetical protein
MLDGVRHLLANRDVERHPERDRRHPPAMNDCTPPDMLLLTISTSAGSTPLARSARSSASSWRCAFPSGPKTC